MAFLSPRSPKTGRGSGKEAKVKDMDKGGKKSQFYVEFLGWMESSGVRGRRYVEPVIQELTSRQSKSAGAPKLTLQLTSREVKISQEMEGREQQRGIQQIKFPSIPARDVTYVMQARRVEDKALDDVVACIYLGYVPRTRRYVHVHVYRFDEPSTAATFTRLLGDIVNNNLSRVQEIEQDLAEQGVIEPPGQYPEDGMWDNQVPTADSAAGSLWGSTHSEESWSTVGGDDLQQDVQSLCEVQPYDSLASELKHRLKMTNGPLLLPPKDYDTISRARGNMMDINERRLVNQSSGGDGGGGVKGTLERRRNGSEESGIDLVFTSSSDDVIQRFPPCPATSGHDSPSGPLSPQTSGTVEDGGVYTPRQQRDGSSSGSVLLEDIPMHPPRQNTGSTGSAASTPLEDTTIYPPRQQIGSSGSATFEDTSVYPPRQQRGGSTGSSGSAPIEDTSFYPPRKDRGSGYPMHPGSVILARQASQSPVLSRHSSRGSRHSENDHNDMARVYRRSHSSQSFGSQLGSSTGGGPLPEEAEDSEHFIPPQDYDDDPFLTSNTATRARDFFGGGMRPPDSGTHPASGSGRGSHAVLKRNWSTSALQTKMASFSGRGTWIGVEEEEHVILNHSITGSVYSGPAETNVSRMLSRSGDFGSGGMRRVNSGPTM